MAMGDNSLVPPPVIDNDLPPTADGLDGLPTVNNAAPLPPVPVATAGGAGLPGTDDFQLPGVVAPAGVASSAEAMNLGLPAVPTRVNGRFIQDIPTFTSPSPKPAA